MHDSPASAEIQNLRERMKLLRHQLTPAEINAKAHIINRRLWNLRGLGRCKRIATYMAVNSEVDCKPIIESAWMRKKEVFLPVLHSMQMDFFPFFPDTPLFENQFGIAEPAFSPGNLVSARNLDVVLMPLLAFDNSGQRIGMGGGYFDRHLSFLRNRKVWRHPRLIGVAYDFQQVEKIKPMPWDIPMSAVITESKTYDFS
jgi:5-formyltetrahydrofolate cyclo-ligase